MARYLEAATQCTILTDANVSQYNQKDCTRPVIYSDDKEERSLSSLLNMFGVRYNRVTRSTIDSTEDMDSSTRSINSISSPTNNRKNSILRRRVVPIDTNKEKSLQRRRKLLLSQNLSIEQPNELNWSNIDDLDTPTTPYEHPWL